MTNQSAAENLLALHLKELDVIYLREFAYVPGRRYRADFCLPGHRLLVEVQGGVYSKRAHGSITGILTDNERLNLATLHGWRLLRFTPDEVNDGRAKAFLKAALM